MAPVRLSSLAWLAPLVAVWLSGCGTTRWTDTRRTATEQMLISDAIDRAVSRIDFRLLAGKEVYLDTSFLGETVDKEYLTSTLRQQMVSTGCVLKEKREQAAFVVEVRAGTVGTDRHDLLYGVPGFNLPTFAGPIPGRGAAEHVSGSGLGQADRSAGGRETRCVRLPSRERRRRLAIGGRRRRQQRPRPVGVRAGPFQRGTIYDHTQFAGDDFHVPLIDGTQTAEGVPAPVRVSQQRLFNSPSIFPKKSPSALASDTPDSKAKLLPPPFSEAKSDASWEPTAVASPIGGGARR